MESGVFRALLAADVAVEMGVLTSADAAAELARYWDDREGGILRGLAGPERARVDAEVERILAEAGGDAQAAVAHRGVDRELPASLRPEASHAISEAGARIRAPLRALDKRRYVGFLPLGEGGMGVVYLALDSELNRRVAFKMIRSGTKDPMADESGPVSDDMVARFMQEAVVTGGLEHPGIVPVYELGIAPSGVPYYTMRLVRGERTLEDGISKAKTFEERLALLEPFLKVCDAVDYAHSRGVIHRDLKPANIALGEFGEVVVLDWGLAKMHNRADLSGSRWQSRLDELREETDLKTLTSALGTPGYMSPEAALGEVGNIDVRSDIYSLGAILHRILTGRFPIEFGTFQEYLAKLTQATEDIAGVPPGLVRITLKALAPKRVERYQTVSELTDALRSWQNESAIDREVDSLRAEAETNLATAEGLEGDALLRRLDQSMAAAARILDLRPGDATAEDVGDRARALRSAAIAQGESATRRRLMRRVGVVGMLAATAATIVVAVLLNARRREAEASRARAEDLAGFMLNDLHDGLVPVGRLDLLATVARKSLEYYSSLPDEDVTDAERRARALTLGRIGEVLLATGDLKDGLRSCLESQRMFEQLEEPYELSVALNRTGDIQKEMANLEGALESFRRSAEIRRALPGRKFLPRSLDRVAGVLLTMGKRDEAVALFKESLQIRRAQFKLTPNDLDLMRHLSLSLERHGELAVETGSNADALKFFLEALEISRSVYQRNPADTDVQSEVAASLFRVAHCQSEAGDTAASTKSFEEVLTIYRRLVDLDPSNTWHQRNLSLTLQRLGNYEEALQIKREVIARKPDNFRARHDLGAALLNVGNLARDRGDLTGAMEHYQEALAIARDLVERDGANTAWRDDLSQALAKVGDLYRRTKRLQQARAAFVESLAEAQKLADGDPKSSKWQRGVGSALYRLQRYEESYAIRKALVEKDPANVTWSRELAYVLGKLGETKKDVTFYEQAVPLHRALTKKPVQQRDLAFCLYMIGTMHEKDDLEKALPPLREAVAIHRGAKGYENEHHFWASAYFRVSYNAACTAALAGRSGDALSHLAENLKWCRAYLDEAQLAAHLQHVREKDPDLRTLRGKPEFAAFFE